MEPRTDNTKWVPFLPPKPRLITEERGASPSKALTNHSINRLAIRFIGYLQDVGFHKEREVAFAHKQAALMKIGRDGWCAPVL